MKHLLNVCNINGAEVEPHPVAVTKSRFRDNDKNGEHINMDYNINYCPMCGRKLVEVLNDRFRKSTVQT